MKNRFNFRESDSNGYKTDNVSVLLDWIHDEIYLQIEGLENQQAIFEAMNPLEHKLLKSDSPYFEDLDEDTLILADNLANVLDRVGYAEVGKYIEDKVDESLASQSSDEESVDGNDEPTYSIDCSYIDESGGEYDGDPRYENVPFSGIAEIINNICTDFLNNDLRGSYLWSPIDRYTDDGELEGISTVEYDNYENKDECSVNRLKIFIEPEHGSEDAFIVILDGDGEVVKDTFGLSKEDEPDMEF